MPTLISVHNSNGCVGRCDAKCYNALRPECDCICGGLNHGVGLYEAIENTKGMSDESVRINCRERGDDKNIRVSRKQLQLELFS